METSLFDPEIIKSAIAAGGFAAVIFIGFMIERYFFNKRAYQLFDRQLDVVVNNSASLAAFKEAVVKMSEVSQDVVKVLEHCKMKNQ